MSNLVRLSINDKWRLAKCLAGAEISIPEQFRNKPHDILAAIQHGEEVNLPPMQAIQGIYVVKGKPQLYGTALLAVARRPGHKVREWIEGDYGSLVAHCEVTRADTGEVVKRTFSEEDAKRAYLINSKETWKKYLKRMLQMRARKWALEDSVPDAIKGIEIYDEFKDYGMQDVTPDDAQHEKQEALEKPKDPVLAKLQGEDIPKTGEKLDLETEIEKRKKRDENTHDSREIGDVPHKCVEHVSNKNSCIELTTEQREEQEKAYQEYLEETGNQQLI